MPRYIPDDVLDQIRLRADIIEVVQSYVPTLKKNGLTWKACCPFHHEKTPSFTVNPARQIFKCFGCGKGGDVFKFVMELENLDFTSAAEFLARKCNIIIPENTEHRHSGSKRESFDGQPEYGTRDRLCTLHEKLAAFYRRFLLEHPDGPVAAYFQTRGIPNDIADKFSIGASPDSWDAAILFARKEGFIDDELRSSGLVSSKDESQSHIYDRFRNRLMFPIWNESGRIVGFSARSVEPDPKGWKYVNTPDSPVFHKGRLLYALNFARTSIPKSGAVVICEGQLDAIAMHRAGVTNAVAPQGTAFTVEQAGILKRYTSTAILATDNDNAGREAVFKDAAILLPLGFSVKVVRYPGAKDADETLSKFGADALSGAVRDARDFFDFALEHALSLVDANSPAGKAAAANDVIHWMLQIDNEVTRDFYFDWLAKQLAVPVSAIEKVAQTRLMDGDRYKNASVRREAAAPAPPRPEKNSALENAVFDLLVLILESEDYAVKASSDLPEGALGESIPGRAAESIIQSAMNGEWDGAVSSIMTSLEMEGADVSPLVEALTHVQKRSDDRAEAEAAVGTITDEKERMRRLKDLASDDDMREVFLLNTYNSCLRSILSVFLVKKRAALIEYARTLPDSPERSEAARRVTGISREILALRKKYPVST